MKDLILKNDNGEISCLAAMPGRAGAEPEAIVIVIHGFGSSKESPTAQMMLEDLPEHGLGALAIDLPGHGTHESFETPLSIKTALDSIETAESYLIEEYAFPRIYYFASSFGAYLTLLYLASRRHTGDKAFLRSAAVNMPELFYAAPDSPLAKELERTGYVVLQEAGPAPVRVTKELVEGLAENDLFEVIPAAMDEGVFDGIDLAMIHGEKDMTIDPAGAIRFAAICDIPLTVMEGEDHTLSTDPASPAKVSAAAVDFYRE